LEVVHMPTHEVVLEKEMVVEGMRTSCRLLWRAADLGVGKAVLRRSTEELLSKENRSTYFGRRKAGLGRSLTQGGFG
jgi:hypothetical protein